MTDPLAEPALALLREDAIEGPNRFITIIYPTLHLATTYNARGYKFYSVLQDNFNFIVDTETCYLKLMVRGIPMGESRPAPGRNGNVYVPTKPHRAELASTIKNLVMEKVGFLPLSFSGQREVKATFKYFFPRDINRTRIADTDNITKFVKDAIEMAGLVPNKATLAEFDPTSMLLVDVAIVGDEPCHFNGVLDEFGDVVRVSNAGAIDGSGVEVLEGCLDLSLSRERQR